jgi:hypothetical protein
LGILSQNGEQFALNDVGALLRTGVAGSRRAAAICLGEEYYFAFGKLLHQLKTGEFAFEKALGSGSFDYYATHPEAGTNFNETMAQATAADATVLDDYDFSEVQTIVDVAGGRGALLRTLLQRFPHLRGILLEVRAVVQQAKAALQASGVEDRCDCVIGDIFQAVPKGGDVYILKRIIHDWGDAEAVAILKNCRRAMDRNGRLLIIEPIVPQGSGPDFAKLFDIVMMTIGGEDRTKDHHENLLAQAGFAIRRFLSRESSRSQCIEAVPI